MDLDFRSKEQISIPGTVCVEVCHQLLLLLKKVVPPTDTVWDVVMTRRTGSYWKKSLKRFAGGFHIHVPNLVVDTERLQRFRETALQDLYWMSLLDGFGIDPTPEDILDGAVLNRRNGLLFVGQNKPGLRASPHGIFFMGQWRTSWFHDPSGILGLQPYGWEFQNKTCHQRFKTLLHKMYDWIFEFDHAPKKPVVSPPAPNGPVVTECGEVEFDLPYFLKICKGCSWDHMHEEWKQVVMFCRIHLHKHRDRVLQQLNAYFKPTDLAENRRVWDSYQGEKGVNEGSIITTLRKLNVAFDKGLLFPGRKYRFHNEHRMFYTKRVWRMFEIEEFFRDVYSTTWGGGATKFIYEEEFTKIFGLQRFKNIGTVITEEMPFSRPKTDVLVNVLPGIEDQIKCIHKMLGQE
jgi:hypothetical protein